MEKHLYEFGPFRIDADERVLWRGNRPVQMTPKVFDLLLVLVEHRGRLLGKDELLQKIWPDAFVEEANLSVNVSVLRRALGEAAGAAQFIETVPRRGYRFIAEVKECPLPKEAVTGQGIIGETELVTAPTSAGFISKEPVSEEISLENGQEREVTSHAARNVWPVTAARPTGEPFISRFISLRVISAITVIGLLAGIGLWWQRRHAGPERAGLAQVKTLAVLPFKSLKPGSGDEYLRVGMADVLITRLSNLNQLVVRPTSSVLPFADNGADALAAGQALKVDLVLDGSIQQIGDRVRVTVRLVRVSDGQPLWAYQSDERGTDVFALQDTISAKVAEALTLKLTGREQQQLAKRYTENLKAFQNYTQGRSHLGLRTRESLLTAVTYYQKAIAEDPHYALAYAGLAEVYANLGGRGYISPREGRRRAEEAVKQALAFDENLAEAHLATGEIGVLFAPFTLAQAETSLRRALELSPNLASIHQYLGNAYVLQSRYDEALQEFFRARELDPLSPILARATISPYYLRRDSVRALELLRQANELRPSFLTFWEVGVYTQNKSFDEALAELEKEKQWRKDDVILLESAGKVYAAQGKRPEALQVIAELEALSGQDASQAQYIAAIYALLGEKESSFAWLDRGLKANNMCFFLKDDPVWDAIRNDPRFAGFLRRVGLE